MPGKLNNRIIIGKILITKTSSTIDDDSRSNVTTHRLQQHMLRSSSIYSMNGVVAIVNSTFPQGLNIQLFICLSEVVAKLKFKS